MGSDGNTERWYILEYSVRMLHTGLEFAERVFPRAALIILRHQVFCFEWKTTSNDQWLSGIRCAGARETDPVGSRRSTSPEGWSWKNWLGNPAGRPWRAARCCERQNWTLEKRRKQSLEECGNDVGNIIRHCWDMAWLHQMSMSELCGQATLHGYIYKMELSAQYQHVQGLTLGLGRNG